MFSKDYILGLVFIGLVAVIWAGSSVVTRILFTDSSFDSPFLLTYLGVSLFTLWLPIRFSLTAARSSRIPDGESDGLLKDTTYQNVSEDSVPSDDTPSPTVDVLETIALEEPTTAVPQLWTDEDHLRVALRIAPVWFIANWSYNASLMYTTITSSTVFASTSSLFTFLLAVIARDESFSWIRLAGTLLGVSGGMLTALHDIPDRRRLPEDEGYENGGLALLGDMLGLVSAVGYAVYAVQTRVYCPKDESLYSMQLVLGYIGLLNMVFLSPVAIYILLGTRHLKWFVMGAVVLKGFFDNFLSDYLWLRAVVLTNATVATVGLGLTIPLAFVSDLVMKQPNVLTPSSIAGALTVLVGFVLVNIGNDEEDETENPIEMASRPHESPHEDDETEIVASPAGRPIT